MCTISMVYDHYKPRIWDLLNDPTPDAERVIDDFRKATEAAKIVDVLTGQPDCEDPEKAKLEDRVAELERQVKKLKAKAKKKKKK